MPRLRLLEIRRHAPAAPPQKEGRPGPVVGWGQEMPAVEQAFFSAAVVHTLAAVV